MHQVRQLQLAPSVRLFARQTGPLPPDPLYFENLDTTTRRFGQTRERNPDPDIKARILAFTEASVDNQGDQEVGADVTGVRWAAILLSTQHWHTFISTSGASGGGVAVYSVPSCPNEGGHHPITSLKRP
jgi:hypothetical protein